MHQMASSLFLKATGGEAAPRPRGEDVHGHGPCTQDVGASAPYAEVPPYVLSVRPAAARMEMPSVREAEAASRKKTRARAPSLPTPPPRHLPLHFLPFKLIICRSHINCGLSSDNPIIQNEDHARQMDLEYQRPQ